MHSRPGPWPSEAFEVSPVFFFFFFCNISLLWSQFAAGLCCGLSCLAAGGTIGILGDIGVRAFGMKASDGRKWWLSASAGASDGDDLRVSSAEGANKLYVGMLIMLIFSEALALYGLIVALILSQHSYSCAAGG